MNEISINFTPLSDQGLYDLASKIHRAITTTPCTEYFAAFKPTAPELKEHIDLFAEALAKETSKSVTALRKDRRGKLIEKLAILAASLEIEANGDLMKLASTGFDLKKPATRTGAPTEIPGNLRLTTTGISGEILAKCTRIRNARSYHAQHALSADGPWTDIDPVTTSQKILFTGLQRGKDIYVRVKAFGPNGYSGWSDLATIMVV